MYSCKNNNDKKTTEEVAVASEQSMNYSIESDKSMLYWIGKKVTGQHNGTVNIKSGNLQTENQKIVAGNFIIDMTSIKVLDLTDEQLNEKLRTHLMHDDFFASDSFPEAKFEITSVDSINEGGNNQLVKGNLTIRGISNNIEIPANVSFKDNMLIAKGKVVLDRTLWNVKYGSGKFFKELGDKMIYDDFEIEIEISAIKE